MILQFGNALYALFPLKDSNKHDKFIRDVLLVETVIDYGKYRYRG